MGLISNGSTVFDNGSMSSGFGSSLRFISKQTASASANISFTSGIDSSYKEYLFTFNNIHPQTDGAIFQFNLSTDGGSNYNVTKTSTMFSAYHNESGDQTDLSYRTPGDLAQSTAFQNIASPDSISSDNDHSLSGTFTIFNPSSTTFVKHFMSNCSHNNV